MFFSPCRAVLSAIFRNEYLTSAVRTKELDKAGSNQPPVSDPVQFKLELTPNYLISYLENTDSRSTRMICIHALKAFEVCASIQIHQSAYHDQTNIPARGRVVVLNYQRS